MRSKSGNRRLATGAAAVVFALAAFGCATTTFDNTWRAPDARPLQVSGKKVLAVFVSTNEPRRRRAEDALAREISARGAQGVASYTLLSQEEVRDVDASRAKLADLGFAGAVVMRVTGRDTEVSYQPGVVWSRPYYRRFWGSYWGWGWGHVWDPGTVRADDVVSVETLVYSFTQDELVWAGRSRTVNPNHLEGLISELAAAVSKELAKAGLVRAA